MCSIYLDSYTQTQSPPSSAHSIDDKSEIYCICLNEKDGKFIGCENKTNCNSYIERKQALGVEGGDWFHMECLNIKSFPKKRKWFCSNCKNVKPIAVLKPLSLLKRELALNNRKIIDVDGDGNCLFSCLAYFKYGYKNLHDMMRKYLYNKLVEIVLNKKFQGRLNYDTCPKDEELNDPDSRFINKLICFYRGVIEDDYDVDSQMSLQALSKYVDLRRDSADSKTFLKDTLIKYWSYTVF